MLLAFSCLGAACTRAPLTPHADVTLRLRAGAATRSLLPDEARISELNLLIFTEEGLLEEQRYLGERLLEGGSAELVIRASLLKGVRYTIAVCANLGFQLPPLTLEELIRYRYPFTYPDEYAHGMPMSLLRSCRIPDDPAVEIPLELERAMARVDLQVDRSALDGDVSFTVESVHVGACPASVYLFQESHAMGVDDIFRNGFFLDGEQSQPLNRETDVGKSATVQLYLLENRQGDLLPPDTPEQDKVLTDSRFADVCSYIELRASYHSPAWHTPPGAYIAYRFYLGEGAGNFDVCRNAVYHVTVRPEGDGLGEDSWRLQKEALVDF